MRILNRKLRLDFLQINQAILLVPHDVQEDVSEGGGTSALVHVDVRLIAHNRRVPLLPHMGHNRRQISLTARRENQGGLLPEEGRNFSLHLEDCLVISKHIVTNHTIDHRFPHGPARLRKSVRSELDGSRKGLAAGRGGLGAV